ncbi:BTB/POZ domain protein [Metarhizium acridum CQMa 102]|uniref:BTB/POZ domain protein n=1 Tax=Metarhizium acridum (strain CQMa 102) TaxID=655827 RepID=E9E3P5_METAQ|nr:BTB/POZ domain protein [Metarhizium acridum CQMa 102]EFY89470.1 BTB/POZ domain protein [Metarhizium acridum CQMa 102]
MVHAPCEARLQISEARRSGQFSDLTFVCGGQQIPAHRIIVCPQSPVIHAACIGPYREQETGIYEIKDVSFDIVRQMVEYLYTGQYEVPSPQEPDDEEKRDAISPLVFHARMFDIADTYLIKGLQSLSMANFKESVRRDLDNLVESVRERTVRHLDSSAEEVFDEITDQIPNFTKDILSSVLHEPILGRCSHCGYDKLVPVVPLQCRCKACGKGGASSL